MKAREDIATKWESAFEEPEPFWILKSGAPIVGFINKWYWVDWESYVVLPQ